MIRRTAVCLLSVAVFVVALSFSQAQAGPLRRARCLRPVHRAPVQRVVQSASVATMSDAELYYLQSEQWYLGRLMDDDPGYGED